MREGCGWPKACAHICSQDFLGGFPKGTQAPLLLCVLSPKVVRLPKVFKVLLVLLLSRRETTFVCCYQVAAYPAVFPLGCSLHFGEPTSLHFHLNISRRKINQTKRTHFFRDAHLKHTEEIGPVTEEPDESYRLFITATQTLTWSKSQQVPGRQGFQSSFS